MITNILSDWLNSHSKSILGMCSQSDSTLGMKTVESSYYIQPV